MELGMSDSPQSLRAVLQQIEGWTRAGVRYARRPPRQAAVPNCESGPAQIGVSALRVGAASASSPPPAAAVAPPAPTREASVGSTPLPVAAVVSRTPQSIPTEPAGSTAPTPAVDRVAQLARLQTEVAACHRCSVLAECRTQTVFSSGSPTARLCFVGEAPGADEDKQGEPFVGAAGQLLNRIIQAMGLKREDVYICNVLKCRPPNNRSPAPDEVANCRGYLEQQIDLIEPEYLCALGAVAAQTLLRTTQSIGGLRRKLHDYRGIPLLCTYHPAYLLRNPAAKRDVWDDVQILMREMGLQPSGAA